MSELEELADAYIELHQDFREMLDYYSDQLMRAIATIAKEEQEKKRRKLN